jgi:hypothetical protein
MDNITKRLVNYVHSNLAINSEEKVTVNGRPYFFVLKIDENKNSISNKFTVRRKHKCLIIRHNDEVLYVVDKQWSSCSNKNRNFSLNEKTREIEIVPNYLNTISKPGCPTQYSTLLSTVAEN